MKKNLLALVALITLSFANAQIKGKGTIEITPKIGVSSFFEKIDKNATKENLGIELGTTIDYYFNNRWSLRSGLVIDKMGYRSYESLDIYDEKLNYLSIPINANWHFGATRKWNLNFGLSPSFLTSAYYAVNGENRIIKKSDVESFQLGFTYGIGYKIEINKKFGILIESQFFNGLTNINKATQTTVSNAGYSYNIGGVFQL